MTLKIFLIDKNSIILYSFNNFQPNSRTFLICEQQNPSQIVHREEKMSRHRGGKQL